MSKEETARKLHELELMHEHKLKEMKELQDRFEQHLNSNQKTEMSLYDRINDLQSDLDIIKKLNIEYQDQVKAKVEVIEERNSVIKQLENKNEKRKLEITDLKE